MQSEVIQIRVPASMKTEADALFAAMGLKTGEAIRVFLQQSINSGGLPFTPHLRMPNAETIAAMRDSEEGRTEETTLNDLRRDMGLA